MPQVRGSGRGLMGLAGYLATSKKRQEQQQSEAALKAKQAEVQNIAKMMQYQKILDKPEDNSPAMLSLARQGLELMGGTPGAAKAPQRPRLNLSQGMEVPGRLPARSPQQIELRRSPVARAELLRKTGSAQREEEQQRVAAQQKSKVSYLKRTFWALARTREKNLYPSGNNLFETLLAAMVPEMAGADAPNLSWDDKIHGKALKDVINALREAGEPVPQVVLSTLKIDEIGARPRRILTTAPLTKPGPTFQGTPRDVVDSLGTLRPGLQGQVYENPQGVQIRWNGSKWVQSK